MSSEETYYWFAKGHRFCCRSGTQGSPHSLGRRRPYRDHGLGDLHDPTPRAHRGLASNRRTWASKSRREAAPIPGQFPKLRRFTCGGQGVPWRCICRHGSGELLTGMDDSNWPIWTQLERDLATEDNYRRWVSEACGVLGDAVAAKAAQSAAIAGWYQIANPYTLQASIQEQSHRHTISHLLHGFSSDCWGTIPKMIGPDRWWWFDSLRSGSIRNRRRWPTI